MLSIVKAEYVPGELQNHVLESTTGAEQGNVVDPCVLDRRQRPIEAPVRTPWGNHQGIERVENANDLGFDPFGGDPCRRDAHTESQSGVFDSGNGGLVGLPRCVVVPDDPNGDHVPGSQNTEAL